MLKKIEFYRDHPIQFCKDILGCPLTEYQEVLFEAWLEDQRAEEEKRLRIDNA